MQPHDTLALVGLIFTSFAAVLQYAGEPENRRVRNTLGLLFLVFGVVLSYVSYYEAKASDFRDLPPMSVIPYHMATIAVACAFWVPNTQHAWRRKIIGIVAVLAGILAVILFLGG